MINPMKKYYLVIDGKQEGPFSVEEIASMAITPDTLVWCSGMGSWTEAKNVDELSSLTSTPPPIPPPIPQDVNVHISMNKDKPSVQLRTHRAMWKFILLSLITLGIYGIVVMSHVSSEINYIASKHDHRNTIHYCLMLFVLSWVTLGIYPWVWWSQLSSRIGNELIARDLPYSFGAGCFWGWYFFGTLILVGPFIYYHKLFKAMNCLCTDYNARG